MLLGLGTYTRYIRTGLQALHHELMYKVQASDFTTRRYRHEIAGYYREELLARHEDVFSRRLKEITLIVSNCRYSGSILAAVYEESASATYE